MNDKIKAEGRIFLFFLCDAKQVWLLSWNVKEMRCMV